MKFYNLHLFLLIQYLTLSLSFSSKENKSIKISYSGNYLIPTVNIKIEGKNIEAILDNNLHYNYISTKNLDLTDINFHYNNDKININDKTYDAFFYIGDLSIYDEKNYLHLENFNSFVIDDKSIFSTITVSFLLEQLKEQSFINKKIFYIDINNKIFYFGEIPLDSEEYKNLIHNEKYIKPTFYSNNTKGIFKQELNKIFIGNFFIVKNISVSFYINQYYTTMPYTLLNDIAKNKIISQFDCNLFLVDQRGIYSIKCHKKYIEQLPNIYFVFKNNYTFNIPLKLLFENYDENYQISTFRTKLKYNNLNKENKEENDEIIIGYSIIKYFNYSIFSYEDRYAQFYSDLFINAHPPIFLNKLIDILLYLLIILFLFAIPFQIYIKYKMKNIKFEY